MANALKNGNHVTKNVKRMELIPFYARKKNYVKPKMNHVLASV